MVNCICPPHLLSRNLVCIQIRSFTIQCGQTYHNTASKHASVFFASASSYLQTILYSTLLYTKGFPFLSFPFLSFLQLNATEPNEMKWAVSILNEEGERRGGKRSAVDITTECGLRTLCSIV